MFDILSPYKNIEPPSDSWAKEISDTTSDTTESTFYRYIADKYKIGKNYYYHIKNREMHTAPNGTYGVIKSSDYLIARLSSGDSIKYWISEKLALLAMPKDTLWEITVLSNDYRPTGCHITQIAPNASSIIITIPDTIICDSEPTEIIQIINKAGTTVLQRTLKIHTTYGYASTPDSKYFKVCEVYPQTDTSEWLVANLIDNDSINIVSTIDQKTGLDITDAGDIIIKYNINNSPQTLETTFNEIQTHSVKYIIPQDSVEAKTDSTIIYLTKGPRIALEEVEITLVESDTDTVRFKAAKEAYLDLYNNYVRPKALKMLNLSNYSQLKENNLNDSFRVLTNNLIKQKPWHGYNPSVIFYNENDSIIKTIPLLSEGKAGSYKIPGSSGKGIPAEINISSRAAVSKNAKRAIILQDTVVWYEMTEEFIKENPETGGIEDPITQSTRITYYNEKGQSLWVKKYANICRHIISRDGKYISFNFLNEKSIGSRESDSLIMFDENGTEIFKYETFGTDDIIMSENNKYLGFTSKFPVFYDLESNKTWVFEQYGHVVDINKNGIASIRTYGNKPITFIYLAKYLNKSDGQ